MTLTTHAHKNTLARASRGAITAATGIAMSMNSANAETIVDDKLTLTAHYFNLGLSAEGGQDDADLTGFQLQADFQVTERISIRLDRLSADGDDTDFAVTALAGLFHFDRNDSGSWYVGLGTSQLDAEGDYFDYDYSGAHIIGGLTAEGPKLDFDAWLRLNFASSSEEKGVDWGATIAYSIQPKIQILLSYQQYGLKSFEDNQTGFCIFGCSESETDFSGLGLGARYNF